MRQSVSFFKYQGAGNDFIIIDNRLGLFDKTNQPLIERLCQRSFGIGADGLMLLETSGEADFYMFYANADGKRGTMCGNGARCIVMFAQYLNIIDQSTSFMADDGIHHAIISGDQVKVSMNIKGTAGKVNADFQINTGSPHYIKFVDELTDLDVVQLGRSIRFSTPYAIEGINVNFVKAEASTLHIRTYERGVEDETLACGTGVTAAALVYGDSMGYTGDQSQNVMAKGGDLRVYYCRSPKGEFSNVQLEGSAIEVFQGTISGLMC